MRETRMTSNELQDDITAVAAAREASPPEAVSRPTIPSWLKGAAQILRDLVRLAQPAKAA